METKKLAKEILELAVKNSSSDIFIFPHTEYFEINVRTNTGIKNLKKVDKQEGNELISYFKFIGEMDIAEHRRPQVGALKKEIRNEKVYLRFSSTGNFLNQEALVIRLIYGAKKNNYFFEEQIDELKNLCQKRGLVITSGPTGSGKTSTMYQLARSLGKDKIVMTIEDPVEIYESRFLQTQINPKANIDYLKLLKAALRNRPDILIIGEIRDEKTAKMAVNAALSGHLVLATVHAKSSLQTISRLEGLGINKSELFNSLTSVSYQRLIWHEKLQEPACLLDTVSGKELQMAILNDERDDFISWKEHITKLRKEKIINEEQFSFFEKG
ncbi:competence type IV pilus ATPase ComGA [Lactobacillus sp. PV034]|uniref:competence type IV pilus ATPase ComGA n=1 Tax=Lactobacillus sp. PV034 TaxID=2594495 RepID=UPI00223FF4BC|nr:competence type IV pilus ATPase ComGA [Lactobacillus sp. PV034]QNQ80683.1 competence protein [Lactobacillus sp. PV034]